MKCVCFASLNLEARPKKPANLRRTLSVPSRSFSRSGYELTFHLTRTRPNPLASLQCA